MKLNIDTFRTRRGEEYRRLRLYLEECGLDTFQVEHAYKLAGEIAYCAFRVGQLHERERLRKALNTSVLRDEL